MKTAVNPDADDDTSLIQSVFSLGPAKVNLTKAGALSADLEDRDTLRTAGEQGAELPLHERGAPRAT